jgi:hypothetical protein
VPVEVGEGEVVGGDQVRQQLIRAGDRVPAGADVGLPDRRVGGDSSFHLTRFDPETPDLDLPVGPADVLDQAGGVPADQVAGAVVPFGAAVEPRQPDEPGGGLPGQVAVPGRQRRATQVELGDLARPGGPVAVDDEECPGAGKLPADRHHLGGEVARDRVAQGEGRRLGGSVHVVQLGGAGRVVVVPAADHPGVELLPADQHLTDLGEALRHLVHHRVEQGHRDEHRVDTAGAQRVGQQPGGGHRPVVEDHTAATGQQRSPDLEAQRVERRVGQTGVARPLGQLDVAGPGQPQDAFVPDLHTLGLAGGPGGVEEEGDRGRIGCLRQWCDGCLRQWCHGRLRQQWAAVGLRQGGDRQRPHPVGQVAGGFRPVDQRHRGGVPQHVSLPFGWTLPVQR